MRARAAMGLALVVSSIALASPAFAQRRPEAAAKDALKKAEDDYLRSEFAKALRRLQTAERACGESACTAPTHAALLRDIGVMQLRMGQHDAALASFRRAKRLDAKVELNPSYDAKDLREAWDESTAAVAAQPAGGDFTHTPARAQAERVPVPVYVVPTTTEAIASVAVRYKGEGMKSFRRVALKKMGEGWGGYVPCADVAPGTMRYYVQGFDKDGELVAASGDPEKPFTVPVRESISGDAPSLPGLSPPTKCGDEQLEALNLADGERCQEDHQCKSGSCTGGVCRRAPSIAEPEEDSGGPRDFARIWIGVAGSLDFTFLPGKSDVCTTSGGVSTSSFWCTTPDGGDYPNGDVQNANLVNGRAGAPSSALTAGSAHVTATLDYAFTANLMVGGRFGYVVGAYPGTAASGAGKTLGSPLHLELRATYLFGDEPIARTGLAGYVFGAAGIAHFDTSTMVLVGEKNVVGDRAVQAWLVAGPAFAATGGGARYAFSPRAAASTGVNVTAAIGPGAFAFSFAPEIDFQYGF